MTTLCAIILGVVGGASGLAGPERTVLLGDLTRVRATVERIGPNGVTMRDERGRERVVARGDVLAVLDESPRWREPETTATLVTLTDGQAVTGTLLEPAPGEEAVRIAHPLFGVVRVALDDLMAVERPGRRAPEGDGGNDAALLLNGDVLGGFVTRIGPAVEIEIGSETRTLALETIGAVRIANEPAPMRGAMAWLADETALRLASVTAGAPGVVGLVPELVVAGPSESDADGTEGSGSIAIERLVAWTPDAARIVPLARAPIARVEPGAGRTWTERPVVQDARRAALGAATIDLPGPCAVTWTLPPNVDGVSCVVELPQAYWDWGDCEVVISASGTDGREAGAWRGRLNAETPRREVALELPRGTRELTVAVEAGELGPVQDMPRLVGAVLRVAPGE